MRNKLIFVLLLTISLCTYSEISVAEFGGTGAFGDIVNFLKRVTTNIVPSADDTYDLGSSTHEWKDVYVDGTLYVDAVSGPGLAPTDADYLVGTANSSLSAEIAVGATPNGDLGGTWGNISVDDDSHAHTSSSLSGIDISADTNLTAGDHITLTDDDLDIDDDFLLNNGDTGIGTYNFQSAAPQLTLGKDETTPTVNVVGQIKMFSVGDNDFYSTLSANTNTSNAGFTLPADEPTGESFVKMGTDGIFDFDTTAYISTLTTSTTTNLTGFIKGNGSVLSADNSAYIPNSGGTFTGALTINDNDGVDAETMLTIGDADDLDNIKVYGDVDITGDLIVTDITSAVGPITITGATPLIFEGATADDFETSFLITDPTTPDKVITVPNVTGTVAVTATAPVTLNSTTGDIGITVLKDLVTTAPLSGGTDDVLPGADADVTLSLTVLKDITASGTGMSGGADDVLPGADADVTITLATAKDIVAGVGLSGGEDNVLPGADADTTLTFDSTEVEATTWGAGGNASNIWTFNLSGTDWTMTAGSALATFSAGVTISGTTTIGTLAGTIDAGDATSLQIPNGANPTTDAAGEIAVDSSAAPGSGIRIYGDAAYTIAGTYSKAFVILNPVATDDYPIWCTPYAITITHVRVQCLGGTNIVGQLTECDAEGINPAVVDSADITATANNSVDDDGTLSNPSIDAGDYIGWATTSISGTPTSVTVSFDYTINQVN